MSRPAFREFALLVVEGMAVFFGSMIPANIDHVAIAVLGCGYQLAPIGWQGGIG
jgi:hypothetical protein